MQPQQQVSVQMLVIADFAFNPLAIAAIDASEYEANKIIRLHLAGPHTHIFEGQRADKAWHWYMTITGQARVSGVT